MHTQHMNEKKEKKKRRIYIEYTLPLHAHNILRPMSQFEGVYRGVFFLWATSRVDGPRKKREAPKQGGG